METSAVTPIANRNYKTKKITKNNGWQTLGHIGLSSTEVKEYIRYIADRRLISLGLKGIFKVKKNPLPWVEEILNAPTHTNFFESRATDYAKGALSGDWSEVWETDK